MTEEYAKLIFPHEADEDLEELWEQKYFEHKKYFLTRTPLPLVWESKLKRLQKEFDAFLLLSNQEKEKEMASLFSETKLELSDDYLLSFNNYQKARAQHKFQLAQATTPARLIKVIDLWLKDEVTNAQYWALPESKENEIKIAQSQEADPMEILSSLQEVSKLIQSNSISDLKSNYNILPEIIQKEVKRLTLLAKN